MSEIYSDQYEELLDRAGKIDERIDQWWAELMGTDAYQKLFELFDKSVVYDTWEDDYYDLETRVKNMKRVLKGSDRLTLILAAFDLGELVGRAKQILEAEQ